MLKKFRAAFDVPTTLALSALLSIPVGLALWLHEIGVGILAYGVMALVLAVLSVQRGRR